MEYLQTDGDADLLFFSRTVPGDTVTVAANLSDKAAEITVPAGGKRTEYFTGKEYEGGDTARLEPWGYMVF